MIDLSIICPSFAVTICSSIGSWLSLHSLFAWLALFVLLIVLGINWLLDTIPRLQKFKAEVLVPWAGKRDHGRRVKAAIKADIESRINTSIMAFGTELPSGWISKMKIDWVESESRDDFFNDGEMVLRIRPLDNQIKNLVRAGHAFLQKAFFPRAKNVIPIEHREASILFTGRMIMARQGNEVKDTYEDIVLEPAVKKNKRILPIMQRYEALDGRGFFMGAFLREVHAVAIGARFDAVTRNKMRDEVSGLLDHIEDFIQHYPQRIPEMLWSRRGPITNYGFLLVARPENVQMNNTPAFVSKARERLTAGVDRLYVFGAEDSRSFTTRVIDAIEGQVQGYQVTERFNLSNDYRGQPGGSGALLVRRD